MKKDYAYKISFKAQSLLVIWFYPITKSNGFVSVTTTFASTADTKSNPFGAKIFLDTTKFIASFISASVISYLGSCTDKDTFELP